MVEDYCKQMNERVMQLHEKKIEAGERFALKRLVRICKLYKVLRPALVMIKKIFFFKKGWRFAVDELIIILDESCNVV